MSSKCEYWLINFKSVTHLFLLLFSEDPSALTVVMSGGFTAAGLGTLTMTYIKYVEKGVETETERCSIKGV